MKKFALMALLSIGAIGFAQERMGGRERMTPEQRTEMRVQRLTKELSLNDKQQKEVKDLFALQAADMEKMRAENKDKKDANREAMKQKMTSQREAQDAKMKSILTADQYKKYTELQKKDMDRMKQMSERRMDHKPAGGMDSED